jgi:hypothetical protein
MNFYKKVFFVFFYEDLFSLNVIYLTFFKFLIFVFTLPLLSRGKLGTNYTLKFQQKVVSK